MNKKEIELIKPELKKFADSMNDNYKKENLIDEYCTINGFNKTKHEFIQIGERIKLPMEFFIKEPNVSKDTSVLASDFIRSLINGENDFILKEIIKSNLKTNKIHGLSYFELRRVILGLKEPTDIFFPIEPFFKKIHYMSLDMPDKIQFISGGGTILKIDGRDLNIHWITSTQEINKIIVLNKKEVKVIRKKFNEEKNIASLNPIPEYEDLNKDTGLMLYFSEKDTENFDFVFRSILSKPELNQDSGIIIDFEDV